MASLFKESFAITGGASPLYWAAEWGTHQQAVMALCNADKLYGKKWATGIRKEQIKLAKDLSLYEPVVMLVAPDQESYARAIFQNQDGQNTAGITLEIQEHFDIWTRDSLPIFTQKKGELEAVGLNFNVWGDKFAGVIAYDKDKKLAELFCEQAGINFRRASLVAEGGAIETNGEGTLLTTRSCLLNSNRNPDLSQGEVEDELMYLTGCKQVIWLEGSGDGDITDGHIDGFARFVDSSTVVAEYVDDKRMPMYKELKENIAVLTKSRNADGKQIEVAEIARPRYGEIRGRGADFSSNYVNFYIANGAVFMAEFGDDKYDTDAHHLMQSLFSSRTVVSLNVDNICRGGGGIHCSLMQVAAV